MLVTKDMLPELEEGFPIPDPFGLKRRGERLANALSRLDRPSVIAVDGPWGSGKSHFLRCFVGEHRKKERPENAPTAVSESASDAGQAKPDSDVVMVYFDAFQHDYLDQPLLSLVRAITDEIERRPSQTSQALQTVAKTAVPKLKRAAVLAGKIGLNWATRGMADEVLNTFGKDEDDHGKVEPTALSEAIAGGVKELNNDAAKALDALWSASSAQQSAVDTLRTVLSELVKDTETKRVVLIVDELDRCRPDFALRFLEMMKHVFYIEGVHFVLGVNLDQLSHSVRAVYGQGYDGEKYLQRFYDLRFPFRPKASERSGNHAEMADYVRGLSETDDSYLLAQVFGWFRPTVEIGFRDAQRIHTLSNVIVLHRREQSAQYAIKDALVCLKVLRPRDYRSLRDRAISKSDLMDIFAISDESEFWLDGRIDRELPVFAAHLYLYLGEEFPSEAFQAVFGDHLNPQSWIPAMLDDIEAFQLPDERR